MQLPMYLLETFSYVGRFLPFAAGDILAVLGTMIPNLLRGLAPESLIPLVNMSSYPIGGLLVQLGRSSGILGTFIPEIDL
ncbi:MAG: hypothetical protein SVK44_07990 [Nitrospirota bacterium]|nr:hypothetical protein [Nitrospirota bacterium]